MKKLIWGAVFIAAILSYISTQITTHMERDDISSYRFYKYVVWVQCLYALIAVGHVVWRLTRGSVSADLKKQVSRRYLEFVIIFTILGLPVNDLLKPEYDYEIED